tara:strand:- start:643 stop:1311 length:669 start_codon:yes stop_codon:yes gene_type:complete
MGYILPEIYQSICNEHNVDLPKVFIETGTFKGGVPHRMLETNGNFNPFEKLYTIELSEDICRVASKRYKLFMENDGDLSKFDFHTDEKDESFSGSEYYFDNKLKLICGDSSEVLKDVLSELDEPACFWLDAHAGASKYARGDCDVPLLKELDVISKHHIKNHILAIDDAHMLGTQQLDSNGNVTCDYSDIPYELVKDKIKNINQNYDVGIYKPYEMEMVLAI